MDWLLAIIWSGSWWQSRPVWSQEVNYLSSLLEGTAGEAVSILKKRFGGTQQIISKHMEALLQVEAVSNSQNVKTLRHLFDNVGSHIGSLASLAVRRRCMEVCCALYWSTRYFLIYSFLSPGRFLKQNGRSAIWCPRLKRRLLPARERMGQTKAPRRNESKPPTSLVTKESHTVPQTCYQLHRPTDCTTVTQVDSRKQLLRKAGRCFSCLRKGRLSRNCRTTSRCQTCHGKHHTSICSTLTTQ